jgi:hypothetical protein
MMRGASSCDAWMFSGSFIAAFFGVGAVGAVGCFY